MNKIFLIIFVIIFASLTIILCTDEKINGYRITSRNFHLDGNFMPGFRLRHNFKDSSNGNIFIQQYITQFSEFGIERDSVYYINNKSFYKFKNDLIASNSLLPIQFYIHFTDNYWVFADKNPTTGLYELDTLSFTMDSDVYYWNGHSNGILGHYNSYRKKGDFTITTYPLLEKNEYKPKANGEKIITVIVHDFLSESKIEPKLLKSQEDATSSCLVYIPENEINCILTFSNKIGLKEVLFSYSSHDSIDYKGYHLKFDFINDQISTSNW